MNKIYFNAWWYCPSNVMKHMVVIWYIYLLYHPYILICAALISLQDVSRHTQRYIYKYELVLFTFFQDTHKLFTLKSFEVNPVNSNKDKAQAYIHDCCIRCCCCWCLSIVTVYSHYYAIERETAVIGMLFSAIYCI